ncbi:signal peptidase II [Paenibacillus soyae]|uniref:Lipoprotein signal peptidase n=1 Tax=Paenibacillus soyae TaxID=2969249 RepID=A0A9X2MPS1_9BACL|nr:signal peptidase II [Paenibacillus soyae]
MRYYYFWVALVLLLLDQITKKIVSGGMEVGDQISVIGEFFKIQLYKNNGAAFSMLPNQRLFFIIVTTAVVIGIIWYILRNRNTGRALQMVALGSILGGAIGNLVDRALYGEVVDFFKLTFGNYIFPIFNIADIGISIGAILILLDMILEERNQGAKAPGNGDMQLN